MSLLHNEQSKRSQVRLIIVNPYLFIYRISLFSYFSVPKVLFSIYIFRLHNEELHSFYRSSNSFRVIKSRRLSWAGHVARMEEGKRAFKILTGKPTGKKPLGRPKRRWEDNIRMGLEEIGINDRY